MKKNRIETIYFVKTETSFSNKSFLFHHHIEKGLNKKSYKENKLKLRKKKIQRNNNKIVDVYYKGI